jgi:hypothetical protein
MGCNYKRNDKGTIMQNCRNCGKAAAGSSSPCWAFCLGIVAFCVMGIVNAVQGNMKPLPLIGKFRIIK